jgi:tetratricopeptide (TPR) repeat protein
MRRSRTALEKKIDEAKTKHEKAIAYYNLGQFHDNNGRESSAIPHYNKALALGLDKRTRAKALAWLASSLHKTGEPELAMQRISESMEIANAKLREFLTGLKARVERARIRYSR